MSGMILLAAVSRCPFLSRNAMPMQDKCPYASIMMLARKPTHFGQLQNPRVDKDFLRHSILLEDPLHRRVFLLIHSTSRKELRPAPN